MVEVAAPNHRSSPPQYMLLCGHALSTPRPLQPPTGGLSLTHPPLTAQTPDPGLDPQSPATLRPFASALAHPNSGEDAAAGESQPPNSTRCLSWSLPKEMVCLGEDLDSSCGACRNWSPCPSQCMDAVPQRGSNPATGTPNQYPNPSHVKATKHNHLCFPNSTNTPAEAVQGCRAVLASVAPTAQECVRP